jgi:hypothetical protein
VGSLRDEPRADVLVYPATKQKDRASANTRGFDAAEVHDIGPARARRCIARARADAEEALACLDDSRLEEIGSEAWRDELNEARLRLLDTLNKLFWALRSADEAVVRRGDDESPTR